MKTPHWWTAFALTALGLSFAGCAQPSRAPVYGGSAIGTPVTISGTEQRGRIVSVRDVTIKDNVPSTSRSGPGGALVTAARVLSGSVTAIAGVVGDTIEGSAPGRPGEEITVEVDDGRTIVLVQERSSPPMAPDERVIIQKGTGPTGATSGGTRVLRDMRFAGSDRGGR